MRISVVIPCYNAERHLGETLDSILAQERPADEIIVADDCSTDGSVGIARSYPQVTLVQQEQNSGCAASRNLAIQHSTGDLIAIIDADDLWKPHHLRVSEAALDASPEASFVFSDIYRFGSSAHLTPTELSSRTAIDIYPRLLLGNFLNQPTVMFTRRIYEACGGFSTTIRYCEDYDLWLQFAMRSKVVFTGETTAGYRIHANQLSKHSIAMFRDTWHARWHALETAESLGSPTRLAETRTGLATAWRNGLYTAWALRSREALDFMLSMADRFPEEADTRKQWEHRRRLWPLMAAADRASKVIPTSLRSWLRPKWGTGESAFPRI